MRIVVVLLKFTCNCGAGGVGRVSILPDCMDGWNCVELGSQPFVTLPNLLRTELFFVVVV